MKNYLDVIDNEYKKKKESILAWEIRIEKDHPEIYSFYKKVLKYYFCKTNKANVVSGLQTEIFRFFNEVISFDSKLDFVYDFQSFLGSCILDDGSFKIIYYENNKHTQIISSKDNVNSYPVIYYGDDFDSSQDVQLLKDAFKKLIYYKKHRYKKIIDYYKKTGYKITKRGTIEKIPIIT